MVRMRVNSVDPVTGAGDMPKPDVRVVTGAGICIAAHSKILAAASTVLDSIIQRPQKRRSGELRIPILGVPYEAVSAFIEFLYSFRCKEDRMEKHGINLLALSHVYLVPQLKQMCAADLAKRISIGNVVDILKLARLCDTPDLYIKCLKLLSNNFNTVEQSEGWKFLQHHDPRLELEILSFIDDAESRKKIAKRRKEEMGLYLQLSEAMECLEHICSEGCTIVGPNDMDTSKQKGPCSKFSTCQGLQILLKHFCTCKRRVGGGCWRCKQMMQLFKLHSSICDFPGDHCRVPLCRHFKPEKLHGGRGSVERWRLLVNKVASAKTASVLYHLHGKTVARSRE